MSMNLTVHTKPCPHCGRQDKIDLYQTPTEKTWEFLYTSCSNQIGDGGVQRPWQETRDRYIEWIKPDKRYFQKNYGKDWKYHFKEAEENIQEHIDTLMKQDWLEFSYI